MDATKLAVKAIKYFVGIQLFSFKPPCPEPVAVLPYLSGWLRYPNVALVRDQLLLHL